MGSLFYFYYMKKYRTKISWGLVIILLMTIIIIPVSSNLFLGKFKFHWIDLIITGFTFGICFYFIWNTFYIIKGKELKIKAGFIRLKTINIESIRKISNIKSIVSAPASSFDRIEIKFNKFDEIAISPKHKKKFVQDLLEINPEILVEI